MTREQHGLGPELGRKPVTYTCRCGYRSTDYGEVARHIIEENAIAHTPRRLTTVPAVDGPPSGIEVASTPHGDANDAVEIRVVLPDRAPGHFRNHVVLVRRSSLPFLIEGLEAHRLDQEPRDGTLEAAFAVCPECHAPWHLHWVYVWEGGERKRRWNTCGLTRDQLEAKWIDGGSRQANPDKESDDAPRDGR